jgi:GNAT superfamily N-acetyltransferase/predicted kinase
MIVMRSVPLDDPTATALWAEQQAELFARYGEPDADAHFALDMPPDALVTSLLAVTEGGEPVGTGLLRWSPFDSGPGSVEVKRLYVRPDHRGRGHSRAIMRALEDAAARAGAVRIVLETGVEQPEALALYEKLGYERIPPYGEYMDDPRSVCFGKELRTRVIVVNGTIGAGKTSTAAGIHDVFTERRARTAFIDGDYLCQAEPFDPEDPYKQRLLFANLAAVAPIYRAAGYGLVTISRVVEDPADRSRYAAAFGVPGAPATVMIVRVTAPEDVRMERIRAREPEGYWQEWGFARTVELEDALNAYDLDDLVIANVGRPAKDTAAELLGKLGW